MTISFTWPKPSGIKTNVRMFFNPNNVIFAVKVGSLVKPSKNKRPALPVAWLDHAISWRWIFFPYHHSLTKHFLLKMKLLFALMLAAVLASNTGISEASKTSKRCTWSILAAVKACKNSCKVLGHTTGVCTPEDYCFCSGKKILKIKWICFLRFPKVAAEICSAINVESMLIFC